MAEEDQDKVINHCPECSEAIDVTLQPPFAKILCPHCDKPVRVRTTLGNYQITRLLGEGGMSQVFLADDLTLDRQVALKVLHRDLSEDKALMALFEREAQLTASINHPNVVKVYKAGSEQGYFFIAMELVDKISLEELIAERGMLNEPEVLDIAHDVASGLRAAFKGGLIHRDIKPGNMLLTNSGTAKLVDFGLAIAHGDEDHVEDLWATPFYVPPEKLDGEPDDFRGDIYSLGATFFHALAGRPPFQANTASMEELKQIKAQKVALHDHASHVSAMTGRLVDRMMAYKPDDRPQSYDELLSLIEAEQERQPDAVKARTEKLSRQKTAAAPAAGRPNWALWLGIGVAVLAAAGVAIAVLNGSRSGGESLITGEERVLTAGEKNVANRFTEARKMLLQGRYPAASLAFSALLESPDIKQPTLGWARFNSGLADLLSGKETDARAQFASMAEATGFDRSRPAEQKLAAFFEKTGSALSDALPVMPESGTKLKTDTTESVALLAYGLKNWNHGQFKSAISFFNAFDQAKPNESWVRDYRTLTAAYQADYTAIQSLPNPRMSMSAEELNAAKEKLETARKRVKTTGASSTFIRKRIVRVQELLDAKQQLATAPPPPPFPGKNPAGSASNPGTDPAAMEMTPEAEAEKKQLAETLLGMREFAANYEFAEVIDHLNALDFSTPPVQRMREDSVAACLGAEAFLKRLVEGLASGEFEGVVRRKEGSPLDARISAASRERVVVDLGFGPNDLEVEKLAPDWMLEVAINTWLNPEIHPPESAWQPWAEAAWFAGMTGQQSEAGQIANQILGKAPDFSERWTRLQGL